MLDTYVDVGPLSRFDAAAGMLIVTRCERGGSGGANSHWLFNYGKRVTKPLPLVLVAYH